MALAYLRLSCSLPRPWGRRRSGRRLA
jgi:hypothetical protein